MRDIKFEIKKYAKRYLRPFGVRRIYEIAFWLTHRCVYSCPYCVLEKNSGPFLPKETVFETIDRCIPFKLNSIQLTGGEPMLHPDFREICEYIDSKKLDLGTHTTGRLVEEEYLKNLFHRNKRWRWWLTIASNRAEINDKYRSPGALEDAMRTADLMNKYGQKIGVHINVVPETLEGLAETIQFAFDRMKPVSISAEPIWPFGRAVHNASMLILDDKQLYRYYCMMTELMPRFEKQGLTLEPVRAGIGAPRYCESVYQSTGINIHPDGKLGPCCYLADEDGCMGDIKDGILKATSYGNLRKFEKRLAMTHSNSEERVKKVAAWSCFECVHNFQVYVKGRPEFKR